MPARRLFQIGLGSRLVSGFSVYSISDEGKHSTVYFTDKKDSLYRFYRSSLGPATFSRIYELGQLHPRRCSLVYHIHPCFFSPCPQLRYRPINALFSLHSQTIFRPRIGRSSVASITSSYHVLFSTPVALFLCCKMALLHSFLLQYAMET